MNTKAEERAGYCKKESKVKHETIEVARRQESWSLELDQSLCILQSMGTILTFITQDDSNMIDLLSLADLGRVICMEADKALDILYLAKNKIDLGES
jgi:hypothetical protein